MVRPEIQNHSIWEKHLYSELDLLLMVTDIVRSDN